MNKKKLIIRKFLKKYDNRIILDIEDFTFSQGSIYTVLGRNGAGKTTLFNCIDGDILFDGGEILYDDGSVERKLAFDDVGIVTSSPVLPEFLTGYEFIDFFIRLNGQGKHTEPIEYYLDLVQINERDRHKLIKDYSYGMKNKIQLLCCFIKNPSVILLDEPLTSFDLIVSHEIKEFLLKIKDEHIIIMSTHIMQLAQDISDEIVLLHQSKLSLIDSEELKKADFEEYVIGLLKGGDSNADV